MEQIDFQCPSMHLLFYLLACLLINVFINSHFCIQGFIIELMGGKRHIKKPLKLVSTEPDNYEQKIKKIRNAKSAMHT